MASRREGCACHRHVRNGFRTSRAMFQPSLRDGNPSLANPALKRRATIRRPSGTLTSVSRGNKSTRRHDKGPVGTIDSSPPFQWRVGRKEDTRAVGTPENGLPPSRTMVPLRHGNSLRIEPGVETPGYCQASLRAGPFALQSEFSPTSKNATS
jgi:hypothetical protein